MIIAVDIGNSNVVLGLVKDSKILQSWRLHTGIHQSVDEYEMLIRGMLFACDFSLKEVQGAVLSSVVPELTDVFIILLENLIDQTPIKVSHEMNLGIKINTEIPAKVGQDRLVNACAAYHQYKTSLIIVDCGTATTLDVVTAEGVFQGGVICPGLLISAEVLFSKAAQLFQVNLEMPENVIGKNTTDSIKSGLIFGYGGMVESLINKLTKEIEQQGQPAPKVVITGGLATKILPILSNVVFHDDLTLRGLYHYYLLNKHAEN
ncbi:MAG TPA: type III pantothenate kinase [Candidatus Lambdaproteobacteria bacterium]|nr:type III pantothenate kinase [SAR324 cluster bacterium]HIA57867.1 type III pantothenate kinase [Candidatus Lambdaproteobacteria bacterium]HIN47623.1 type III pantothenate kinase [Deltaproteobacteria bacterium]HIB46613.1 type III pantothenate kinase [Candidatus Lambdaproteobacteria bacterium]HIB93214.1 type III pantothenate kinase [Candidatus Lambdaproteobacteria bacterium]